MATEENLRRGSCPRVGTRRQRSSRGAATVHHTGHQHWPVQEDCDDCQRLRPRDVGKPTSRAAGSPASLWFASWGVAEYELQHTLTDHEAHLIISLRSPTQSSLLRHTASSILSPSPSSSHIQSHCCQTVDIDLSSASPSTRPDPNTNRITYLSQHFCHQTTKKAVHYMR